MSDAAARGILCALEEAGPAVCEIAAELLVDWSGALDELVEVAGRLARDASRASWHQAASRASSATGQAA